MKTLTIAASMMLVLLLGTSLSSFAVEVMPGNIRVLKVKGDVSSIETSTKKTEPLKEGTFLKQDHSVKTGSGSMAVLLFSNGTTITVKPESVFSVETFQQAPFDSTASNYKEAKEEPSVSKTKVSVSEGSILADVAKLSKGSTFDIGTPAGVAGIRGTIVSITIGRPSGNSRTVTVDLPEGEIDFSGIDGKTVTLSNGMTITFSLAGGTLTPSDITPLSPQRSEELMGLIEQALDLIPGENVFEGVEDGSPEQLGGDNGDDNAGGFGGDQGAGSVGTAPTGGSGGGGGGGSSGNGGSSATPTPTPTPNPPPS